MNKKEDERLTVRVKRRLEKVNKVQNESTSFKAPCSLIVVRLMFLTGSEDLR